MNRHILRKGYVYIRRKWAAGDKMAIRFPMEVCRAWTMGSWFRVRGFQGVPG